MFPLYFCAANNIYNHNILLSIYSYSIAKLQQNDFRAKIDLRSEKINYKIREHSLQKIPYILIIGEKEANENKVSIREFGSKKEESLSLEEFIKKMAN